MDNRKSPIEPGPEPDTTDAAEPDPEHTDARLDPEDAPEMLGEDDGDVDDTYV